MKNIWYFRVFKFYIFTTNSVIIFFYFNLFRIYWKYFSIILSFISYLFGENKSVHSNKLLPFNMKSINTIQKYPNIIESYVCILKIFVIIYLLPINFLNSSGVCSTPKLSKYVTLSPFPYKAIQWVPIYLYSPRLIAYAPFFITGRLFLE